jgi:hypothetical protein
MRRPADATHRRPSSRVGSAGVFPLGAFPLPRGRHLPAKRYRRASSRPQVERFERSKNIGAARTRGLVPADPAGLARKKQSRRRIDRTLWVLSMATVEAGRESA